MNKILQHIIIYISLLSIIGCQEEERRDLQAKVLVESFIYYGQKQNTINFKLFSPLSSLPESPFLNPERALLTNLDSGVSIFPEFDTTGIYFIDLKALNAGVGDRLQLEILYKGETVLARTEIPGPPENLEFNNAELKLNYLVDAIPERITLSWFEESENYFLVKIDTAERDPDLVDFDRIAKDEAIPFESRVGIPISNNEIEISYPDIEYFGWHRIIVFHISKTYFELYNNPVQGSYNKVDQSVANGLGIFTAMNSDTIIFRVIP